MSSFGSSTHRAHWMFTRDSLTAVLREANAKGRASVLVQKPPAVPRAFACVHSRYFPEGTGEVDTSAHSAFLDETTDVLTADEESALKAWHLALIFQASHFQAGARAGALIQVAELFLGPMCGRDAENERLRRSECMCGRDAENERLRRSERVQAGARALFQRFFLSNSIMEFDPKLVMLAAIFLVSKIEDQIIPIEELERATNTPEFDMLAQEVPLLAGTRFQLRIYTPYPPLLGLVDQADKYITETTGGCITLLLLLLLLLLRTAHGALDGALANLNAEPRAARASAHSAARNCISASGAGVLSKLHDAARATLDGVLATDLPLLHAPARLALAALLSAAAEAAPPPFDGDAFLHARFAAQPGAAAEAAPPPFDGDAFLHVRVAAQPGTRAVLSAAAQIAPFFDGGAIVCAFADLQREVLAIRKEFAQRLPAAPDLVALKAINKKLKQCALWRSSAAETSTSTGGDVKKKKKRKRVSDEGGQAAAAGQGAEGVEIVAEPTVRDKGRCRPPSVHGAGWDGAVRGAQRERRVEDSEGA
ncbi:hypothetical protein JKP88DRAFT_339751 [Tribonema minus]|uniref:Cyclin N-terminal domain-containing protein n=1 Tax=Tribonema minus TaxID=303371 RepID=A0A836C6K6_9STRA|nr:hypothetical protein JKP88DRAFT_339751 [Tribonema minus]